MPDKNEIVINTGPLIAIVAATGNLEVLKLLYNSVHVPIEVAQEIAGNHFHDFATKEFNEASFLIKLSTSLDISPFLRNVLDIGEASVIQLAIDKKISTVCIDEKVGRRIAKLNNLLLTGSIGILIKAKNLGYIPSIKKAISEMKQKGIYLSDNIVEFALKKTNEF